MVGIGLWYKICRKQKKEQYNNINKYSNQQEKTKKQDDNSEKYANQQEITKIYHFEFLVKQFFSYFLDNIVYTYYVP